MILRHAERATLLLGALAGLPLVFVLDRRLGRWRRAPARAALRSRPSG